MLGLAGPAACTGGEEVTGGLGPPATGSLVVAVGDAPAGGVPAVQVTGPAGYVRALAATDTLRGLVPGSYTVAASDLGLGGHTWAAVPATQSLTVAAGSPPAAAAVRFEIATGALALGVSGLPDDVPAALTLTGPGGQSFAVQGNATLTGLQPGAWALAGPSITVGASTWVPALPAPVAIGASTTPVVAEVRYSREVGTLELQVSGLPPGAPAALRIAGPGDYSAAPTGSSVLTGLDPGGYFVTADSVRHAGHTWRPTPVAQQVTVTAGASALAPVQYAIATGGLTVTVAGLPEGTPAAVTITGPGGFTATAAGTAAWVGILPGTYLVTGGPVTVGGQAWQPTPASQTVQVAPGTTPALASLAYAPVQGALAVTISGLPGGTAAAVAVSGPAGFGSQLSASATLQGISPGSYMVAATAVTAGSDTWDPSPASQAVAVTGGTTASASVQYVLRVAPPPPPPPPPGPTLNLRIDGLYLTQASQRYDGSVPLVAGRDAYLRVFAVANQTNGATPPVRVRLYQGASLVQTWTLPAPGGSVPLSPNEASLSSSWNVLVPGSLVQPGLRVLADVDPSGATPEANEADNAFPAGGTPAAVDVRAVPTFALRFVPVLQQVNGLQGNVSDGNKEQYLADVKSMLPVAGYAAEVRAPYTTTAPVLQSDNANDAWGTILSELLALRAADGSARYYYGVVQTTYASGVAGIGYVGGGARTALGWDRLPSGSGVMAHELGHNMGRSHAPCGGAGGADPSYPYPGGGIGVWGFDVAALSLKSPSTYKDLMGYCSPDWVSDYNWSAMVSYRQGGSNNAGGAEGRRGGRGLLVWGRLAASGLVLEPGFVVDAPAMLPAPGPHRLELVGFGGDVLQTIPFAPAEVHDLPTGREEAFAFVVPFERGLALELATVRLRSGGRVVERRVERGTPTAAVTPDRRGGAMVRWDVSDTPMLLVRDDATGAILSFARGGEVRLPVPASRVRALRPAMK